MTIRNSFLARTGQAWKPFFGLIAVPILGVALLAGLVKRAFGLPDDVAGFLLLVTGLAILSDFVWVTQSVRCPSCGTRLLLKAMREEPLANCMEWLDSLLLCPVCGSSGDEPVGRNGSQEPRKNP